TDVDDQEGRYRQRQQPEGLEPRSSPEQPRETQAGPPSGRARLECARGKPPASSPDLRPRPNPGGVGPAARALLPPALRDRGLPELDLDVVGRGLVEVVRRA